MKRRTPTSLERLARFTWQFKLTPCGQVLVITGILVGTLTAPTLEMSTFLVLFAMGVIAWVLNMLWRPRVEVSGAFPDKATAGQAITGAFDVTNRSRWPIFDLAAGYFGLSRSLRSVGPQALHGRLDGKETARVSVTLTPLRRGIYELPPLRAYSTFPFNICRTGARRQSAGSLLVLPEFHPLTGVDVPLGTRYQPGGIALTSDVGESPEYIGNREYFPGDPTRHIDFRAWARLARPAVREFQEEYYCRIALVLDTYIPRGRFRPRAGFPNLEAAVSLSAAVADALSRGEYIIDIFAAGPELYVFRAGRHTAHLESVLELLAGVDECRSNPFETVAPALTDELGSISTVICVFLDWDDTREELVRLAFESGCGAKILVVRDGPTTKPFEPAEDWAGPIVQVTPQEVQRGGLDQL